MPPVDIIRDQEPTIKGSRNVLGRHRHHGPEPDEPAPEPGPEPEAERRRQEPGRTVPGPAAQGADGGFHPRHEGIHGLSFSVLVGPLIPMIPTPFIYIAGQIQ